MSATSILPKKHRSTNPEVEAQSYPILKIPQPYQGKNTNKCFGKLTILFRKLQNDSRCSFVSNSCPSKEIIKAQILQWNTKLPNPQKLLNLPNSKPYHDVTRDQLWCPLEATQTQRQQHRGTNAAGTMRTAPLAIWLDGKDPNRLCLHPSRVFSAIAHRHASVSMLSGAQGSSPSSISIFCPLSLRPISPAPAHPLPCRSMPSKCLRVSRIFGVQVFVANHEDRALVRETYRRMKGKLCSGLNFSGFRV